MGLIKDVYENYKKTMNQSTEHCHNCEYYSYKIVGGGLWKIEHCRKYHKNGSEECPDWEQFNWQKPYTYVYYHGRIED